MSKTTMGKVLTDITITNRADQVTSQRGFMPADQVRSVSLKNVLVDTGATTLCLSSETIEKLGLELLKEVPVATANGTSTARVFPRCKDFALRTTRYF